MACPPREHPIKPVYEVLDYPRSRYYCRGRGGDERRLREAIEIATHMMQVREEAVAAEGLP